MPQPERVLDPSSLKDRLRRALEGPRAEALAGRGGVRLSRAVAGVYDGALRACFEAADGVWREAGGRGRVALVAVGGWGRATLGFGSDLDLVILSEGVGEAESLAESLLYPLWDAGVSVGHAVRTPREFVQLGRTDLRSATMMLDGRFLGGDRGLAEESLAEGRRAMFDGDLRAFLRALEGEMAERHARFGATVYLLEPDLKHGRGGLRDLDIARWALAARFRVGDFHEALRAGALREVERDALEAALEAAWSLRLFVHARRGRRVDRLTFDEQEEVARVFQPLDPEAVAVDEDRALGAAVEVVMSGWYRRAREVSTVIEHLLPRCRPARSDTPHPLRTNPLAQGVVRFDGTACFSAPDVLSRDPAAALRLVEVAVAHGLPIGDSSRATVAAAAADTGWCSRLRQSSEAGPSFMRLLTDSRRARLRTARTEAVSATPDNPESVLAELHDLGLLLAMIPEFAAVTSKVQHDVYHVYTVDVHSVAAVDRLHALARAELGEDFALATKLLPGTDRRDVLCLGILLHDVGKAQGRSHAQVGAELAPGVARRLGLGDDDAATVAWLVAEHLSLYHVATRRDLADPVTVRAVRDTVGGDPWRLRALYLLTVADLSTTSPTAMNAWKSRMLGDLYRTVAAALGGAEEGPRREALEAQCVAWAPRELQPAVAEFVARMPLRYLRATAPEAVARHAAACGAMGEGGAGVQVVALPGDGTLGEVLVRAPDRPGLLYLVAGVLHAHGLDVQRAEIHGAGEVALDVFVVRLPHSGRDAPRLAALGARMQRQLRGLLAGVMAPPEPAPPRGIARPEPAVANEVTIVPEASDEATVLEVYGRDRPGFLLAVTRALTGAEVQVRLAKVNTEGRRAADVFYLVGSHGQPLDPAACARVVVAVRATLDP